MESPTYSTASIEVVHGVQKPVSEPCQEHGTGSGLSRLVPTFRPGTAQQRQPPATHVCITFSSQPVISSRSSSSSGYTVPANNFAQNGGVESGLTNWSTTAGTVARSTADKRSGSASALITGRTGSWNGLTFATGSLVNGSQYDVAVWVKLAPGTPDSVVQLTAKRQEDSDTSTYNEYTRVATATASSTEWRLLQGYYTQSGSTAFQHFIIEATDATISYYADDFSIGGQAPASSSSSSSSSRLPTPASTTRLARSEKTWWRGCRRIRCGSRPAPTECVGGA